MANTSAMVIEARAVPSYVSLLKPPLVGNIYLWGYLILFILGFTGNICSLFTFTRPALRSVSTSTLFITLAISDICFLLVSVIDFIDFGLQIPLSQYVNYVILCRCRVFIMSMTQICSAWVLVIISTDRWIRTRFPYKSTSICTQKKALLAVAVVIVLDAGLHAIILTPMFGVFFPGVALLACAPLLSYTNYFVFYFTTWTILQVFINCIIPVVLMLIFLLDMFLKIRLQKKALGQQIQVQTQNQIQNQAVKRNNRLQKQLFALMLASITIFLTTTLPVAIYRVIFPKELISVPVTQFGSIAQISACLTWFWGFNYAINFYIHCLTSTLFRKEFMRSLSILFNIRGTPVGPVTVMTVRLHQ